MMKIGRRPDGPTNLISTPLEFFQFDLESFSNKTRIPTQHQLQVLQILRLVYPIISGSRHRLPPRKKTGGREFKKDSESIVKLLSEISTVIGILCNFLGFLVRCKSCFLYDNLRITPELTTQSGLKRVRANFDAIYQKIDAVFDKCSGIDTVLGGIVGIYAKMCVDSILRDKLFQGGMPPQI